MERDLVTQKEKAGERLHHIKETPLLADREWGDTAEELNPFPGEWSVE